MSQFLKLSPESTDAARATIVALEGFGQHRELPFCRCSTRLVRSRQGAHARGSCRGTAVDEGASQR